MFVCLGKGVKVDDGNRDGEKDFGDKGSKKKFKNGNGGEDNVSLYIIYSYPPMPLHSILLTLQSCRKQMEALGHLKKTRD